MIHTMKNIIKFITLGIALLAGTVAANAQTTWNVTGGVATAKNVSAPDENGLYTITLETYGTGESSIIEKGVPCDIVLVLDVSGSMDENMSVTTYTETSRDWTYNNFGNTAWYYKDGDTYRRVRRGYDRHWQSSGMWGQWVYDGYYFYLDNNENNRLGEYQTSETGVIYSGPLYTQSTSNVNKMTALRNAVNAFVDEVHHNSLYDTDGNLRGTPLVNQISIVKFAMDQYYGSEASITPGNHRGAGSDGDYTDAANSYNYTEVVTGFTDVSGDSGVTSIKNDVAAIRPGGGTAIHYGIKKAYYLLQDIKESRPESSKTVVVFTDGMPQILNTQGFFTSFANSAIRNAADIKKSTENGGEGATVYSIGVFSDLGNNATNVNNFMNYISSNYPNAQAMNNAGTGSDQGYYQNASNADLNKIFKDIASAASQSDATVDASTQVRDVVSNSFILPDGASADDDVTIYTMDITEDGKGWENRQTPAGVTAVFKTATGSDGVEREMLSVEGFDFTAPDVIDETTGYPTRETAGNFVGERYKSKTETFWAGKKLVIEFKVQANSEATGGDGSATNHSDSGVYIYDSETDTYTNVNHYPMPHTNLPMIIKIKKDGLRHGESATFEVQRCAPLVVDGEVQYNAIGKPLPDPNWIDPVNNTDNEKGFHTWSKVIITNKGINGDPVTKVLYALDPYYVYKVIEDDWGWAYELSGTATLNTTSDVEINPFTFHNTEKEGVAKHAEAVSINHFATSAEGEAEVENYQSSKVKSF